MTQSGSVLRLFCALAPVGRICSVDLTIQGQSRRGGCGGDADQRIAQRRASEPWLQPRPGEAGVTFSLQSIEHGSRNVDFSLERIRKWVDRRPPMGPAPMSSGLDLTPATLT